MSSVMERSATGAPHTLDTIHRFLQLGLPERITAVKREGPRKNIFPMATTIKFDFPERGPGMPAMDTAWYDGKENLPPRPKELEEDRNIETCGKIIYSKDLVLKGGTLEFDRTTKQITNNKIANQLLIGAPPRKGWEEFYKL